jgi:hypothetical protein
MPSKIVPNSEPPRICDRLYDLVVKYVEEKIPGPLRDILKALS